LRLADEIGKHVTVHGAVSQNRLAEIMKRSHVFVLPLFYEGLPLGVLEALASGCRIVATDLPGVTEILGDMNADFIDLVATPRLRDVDKPMKEDQNRFETDLKDALRHQIVAAEKQPTIDLSGIAERMSAFSWDGIFKKVQAVYDAAAASR
jgi:glycosyltransferase involved in cell wall biosynthesis